MAEEEVVEQGSEKDEEYEAWLEALEEDNEDDDPAVAEVEHQADEEEEKALKVAMKTKKAVEDFLTEEKVKDIEDRFDSSASDEEKELLTIYRRGDENPAQLKKLMQLVHTKVSEAHKPKPEQEDQVRAQAKELAKEAYGAGPIDTSKSAKVDKEKELIDRIAAGGPDSDKALVEAFMMESPPPWARV